MTDNYKQDSTIRIWCLENAVVRYLAHDSNRIFWSHRDRDGHDCFYDSEHDTVIQFEHVYEIACWQIYQWDDQWPVSEDLRDMLRNYDEWRPINLDPDRYYPNQGKVVYDKGMYFVNAWFYSEANEQDAPDMKAVQ